MASPPFRRVTFGGVSIALAGRRQGFALTNGKAERVRLTAARTEGRRAAAPFSVRNSPIRTSGSVRHAIQKPLGLPTSRATRGTHGLRVAQTHVSTVSAGVTRRNPTKHF